MEREEYYVPNRQLKGYNPLTFGEEYCKPQHSFGPGKRTYWLLHYIVSGKGYYTLKKKTYTVTSGQIFVARPGELIFYEADKNDPWHYMWIGFEANTALPSIITKKDIVNANDCEAVFSDILKGRAMKAGQAEYISGKIWELVAKFTEIENPVVLKNEDYAERAKTIIHARYQNGITVAQMAKMLNLERSYFSTVFRKTVGMSPQEYLKNYRLDAAANMISEEGVSVSEAAFSTGYTNIVNFSRMFKRKFGVSPSDYAKSSIEKKIENGTDTDESLDNYFI